MAKKTYAIFGAGASGLYTAWRLLGGGSSSKQKPVLKKGDKLSLFEWGDYAFEDRELDKKRAPGARIFTWHYNDDTNNSYLEIGGMRYAYWDGNNNASDDHLGDGHRVVSTVIRALNLEKHSVPFNEATNPMYYLRTRNMYLNSITSTSPAPYNVDHFGATESPDTGFGTIQDMCMTPEHAQKMSRNKWCGFYKDGTINVHTSESSVFKKGDRMRDIGYWNLMFDQLGSEGYNYISDGNGYCSNVINWNASIAIQSNNEFTPGNQYRTLDKGYSSMFNGLFNAIKKLAHEQGVEFVYTPNTRLHSILKKGSHVHYTLATRSNPDKQSEEATADFAWMAMPRYSIDLVAQATRYMNHDGVDVLNHPKVQLYLESAIMQPSYKVGMFFDKQWWTDPNTPYPAQIEGYVITDKVADALETGKVFTAAQMKKIRDKSANILYTAYTPAKSMYDAIEQVLELRLTIAQENQLKTLALNNTIGPSITDMPIRQVVYFGNNASSVEAKKDGVYGVLASYDDMQFTSFWQELEIEPNTDRKKAISQNYAPLDKPKKVPAAMEKMLMNQMAKVHFGPSADGSFIEAFTGAKLIEARYVDWSLPPFNAGYHAYAAHYDIGDVMRKIRKPSQLLDGDNTDANIFIVGETYSIDQAWVEGAYCTAESVLNDFFGVDPIIPTENYPFICPE